jgi:hypothetical protein
VPYTLIVAVPIALVWIVVLVDVLARRDLTPLWKAATVVAVTLLWPTMILYLLLRPVQGRLVSARQVRRETEDPRQELVGAVMAARGGRLAPDEVARTLQQLRENAR